MKSKKCHDRTGTGMFGSDTEAWRASHETCSGTPQLYNVTRTDGWKLSKRCVRGTQSKPPPGIAASRVGTWSLTCSTSDPGPC